MIKKNIFSIALALLILYLSLAPGDSFDKVSLINIPHFDKIAHFVMYLTFMSVIIFENRKRIKDTKQIVYIALIPFSYGIIMEIFQFLFTSTRTGSLYDILFNLAGVIFSILIWFYIKSRRRRLLR